MLYGPKICTRTNKEFLKNIPDNVCNVVEFHVHRPDMFDLTSHLKNDLHHFVNKYSNIERYVYHMPMQVPDIMLMLTLSDFSDRVHAVINSAVEKSRELNVEIMIVSHCLFDSSWYASAGAVKKLRALLDTVLLGSRVFIALENAVTCINYIAPQEYMYSPAFEMGLKFNHPNLVLAFDISHYRLSCMHIDLVPIITSDVIRKIAHIHFSYTVPTEHSYNRMVHGRMHTSPMELYTDLEFIKDMMKTCGKLVTSLVAEINETDYENRRDLIQEMHQISKESWLFNDEYR